MTTIDPSDPQGPIFDEETQDFFFWLFIIGFCLPGVISMIVITAFGLGVWSA